MRRSRCYKLAVRKKRMPVRWLLGFALAVCISGAVFVPRTPGSVELPRLLGDGPDGRLTWQVRPASIAYTGDGSGILGGFDGTGARHASHPGHLTWQTWTRKQATGSGAVWADDCTPDCAEGKFTAHAVRVRAFRPVRGHFTRLTLRYRYHGKRYIDRRGIERHGGKKGFWAYYIVGH
jgi:hypothetical protein